jgi:hypothetical protein
MSSYVIIRIIFHDAAHHRPATSHCPTTPHSYTHTHLHNHNVPVLGCHVKAADAVVAREEEEVATALLDEQLW